MKESKPFSIKSRVQSFVPAFNGVLLLFKSEHNAWVHLLLMVASIITGILLQINSTDWLFLTLAITMVFMSELINTAIEKLADKVEPNFNPTIGAIKDYASAAVLMASIFAIVVGSIVFGTKIFDFIYGLGTL